MFEWRQNKQHNESRIHPVYKTIRVLSNLAFFLLEDGEWRLNFIQSPKQTAEKYPVSCSYLPSLIEISRRFRSTEPVGLFFVYQKKEKEFCLFIFIPFCSDYYKAAVQPQLWEPTPIRDIKKKTTTTKNKIVL